MEESIKTPTRTHSVVCSLIKSQSQVIYDYYKNACSLIFTVHTVRDRLRDQKISTAVFKYDRDNNWYPHHIEVVPEYQRQGVAQTMYDIVHSEISGDLIPSGQQSTAAQRFWQHRLTRPYSLGKNS